MKSLLPENDRILLGPGPSMTSPRVMRAMASPTVGHLDPLMLAMLDDTRANIVKPGSKGTGGINGYSGDRLAQMCERYGATVTRVNGEWGRAFDPVALE